jgi:hypothetical protein
LGSDGKAEGKMYGSFIAAEMNQIKKKRRRMEEEKKDERRRTEMYLMKQKIFSF